MSRLSRTARDTAWRLRALRELRSVREFALFVYLSVFAAAVPLLMRLPLPRLAGLVTRPVRGTASAPGTVERLATLTGLAVRLAHPLVRTGCLTRGVTLFWFLRRAGNDVELVFGLDAARSDGHCWLVHHGEPILEKEDPRERFGELYRLPLVAA